MRKWNCVLKFSDHVPTEWRRLRKALLFGYLIGARKACKATCSADGRSKIYNSNSKIPVYAPHISELQYVPGLLGVDTKFYHIGFPSDCRYVIFPKHKIFVPDLRDKRVFNCFIRLVVQHKMVQYRRPFIRLANEREIARNERTGHTRPDMRYQRYGKLRGYVIEKRIPKRPKPYHVGLIKPYRFSYNKKMLKWYSRKELQEVFHNPLCFTRQITKHDIEILWKWLKVGKFEDLEIQQALVDKYGIEIISWFPNK